jgi:hypothetical protein
MVALLLKRAYCMALGFIAGTSWNKTLSLRIVLNTQMFFPSLERKGFIAAPQYEGLNQFWMG